MAGGMTVGRILFVTSFLFGLYCCMGDQGTATFYTPPYVPSACYGYDQSQFPAGNLFAAASDAIWDNGGACGRQYRITCTSGTNQGVAVPCKSGSIVVKIVDYCPAGCHGTFDLSADAFADIADPDEGKINIDYEQV
uniref:Expansin-like EG45 domain-containing protein n=1 Tax=Araucaria cunninghamii TaxID=56994 RepID=A0A0D6R0K7_ARACU